MRCRECDYPLWNLPARACPECGSPFHPSEFDFVPNSVQYCCPSCGQDYYGTDPKGHLHPRAFDCVKCGRHVHMDEMVLRPTEGVDEERTQLPALPWIERKKLGFFSAWFKTIGMSMVSPGRMFKAQGGQTRGGEAMWFMVVTNAVAIIVGLAIPVALLGFLPGMGTGFGNGQGIMLMVMLAAGALLGGIVSLCVCVLLWAALTHGLLRLTGGAAAGFGRTFEAICYGSGPSILMCVPCLGFYCSSVSGIWWLVASSVMVAVGQRVHGGRAAFAVLTPPIVGMVLFTVLYVLAMMAALGGFAAMGPGQPFPTTQTQAQAMNSALQVYRADNMGAWPDHPLELLGNGQIQEADFVSDWTMTTLDDIPAGDTVSLQQYRNASPTRQSEMLKNLVDSLPPADERPAAVRVGDFVFTYQGMDSVNSNTGLWMLVMIDENLTGGFGMIDPVEVVLVDGTRMSFARSDLPIKLADQNVLRASAGLPPLPDPAKVTH